MRAGGGCVAGSSKAFGASRTPGVVEHMTQMILLLPLSYVILQWLALQRMRRAWQVAAALPAVFMALALGVFIVGILTGADLAALLLVIGMPVATGYLVLLFPLHWVMAGGARRVV